MMLEVRAGSVFSPAGPQTPATPLSHSRAPARGEEGFFRSWGPLRGENLSAPRPEQSEGGVARALGRVAAGARQCAE